MTDNLSADELAEIEAKVLRYRNIVTTAALRRRAKHAANPKLLLRRQMKATLAQDATKLAILRRVLAGEPIKDIAAQYDYSAGYISSYIHNVVLDQMEHRDGMGSDHDCKWCRALTATRKEFYAVWCPLALQRLAATAPA